MNQGTSPTPEESAQIWLRVHRRRSRVQAHRDINEVERIIAEAHRCADVIRDSGAAPGAAAWAQDAADGISAVAREHIERTLRPIAVRRAAREAADAEDARAAEASAREQTNRARARARDALLSLAGMDVVIDVDGERMKGSVTSVTHGPLVHVALADGREMTLRLTRAIDVTDAPPPP